VVISITGGTGFVGRNLVRRLSADGHELRLLRRPGRSPGPPVPARGEVRTLDFAAPDALAGALAGSDAVVHLVGIIAECGPATYERVHVGLTRSVVEAAQRAGVPRLVHMSALGTRPQARSRYHQTKWQAESIVRDSRLAWTIFRPSLIFGPDDAFTRLFDHLGRWSPIVPVVGGGRNLMQPIGIHAVVQAFSRSLNCPPAVGGTFDLCGPERLSFRTILEAIVGARGRHRLFLPIPMRLARLQATLLEGVYPALLRRPPPLNRDQLRMLEEDNVGDGAPADRLLGLTHEPLAASLRRQFGTLLAAHPVPAPEEG